jgi:predicted RNA methylase
MKSYPFQVFRHRVYLPCLNVSASYGDFRRKVITEKIIELDKLGLDPNVGVQYETASYKHLKIVFNYAYQKGFVQFCDIGCGLGRGLLVASEVGFGGLKGIDISPILLNSCKKNILKRGLSVELICTDVDNFELPDEKLVIYMFNPFGEDRMRRLVKKLESRNEESLIIYYNPKHYKCFKQSHKIAEIVWRHFGLYDEKCFFYLIPSKLKT